MIVKKPIGVCDEVIIENCSGRCGGWYKSKVGQLTKVHSMGRDEERGVDFITVENLGDGVGGAIDLDDVAAARVMFIMVAEDDDETEQPDIYTDAASDWVIYRDTPMSERVRTGVWQAKSDTGYRIGIYSGAFKDVINYLCAMPKFCDRNMQRLGFLEPYEPPPIIEITPSSVNEILALRAEAEELKARINEIVKTIGEPR